MRLGPGGLYANIVVGLLTVIVFSGSALAQPSEKIYWTEWNSGKLRRANLDGTGVEDFITGTTEPDHIAFDLTNSHIYWVSDFRGAGKIKRANLDGSGVQDLITGLTLPSGIALDVTNSHIFWTSDNGGAGSFKIHRANLDGTGVQDHITGLNSPVGIALGPVAQASSSSGEIRYVPFKSKYVLMALMALLGCWLIVRAARRGVNENSDC